MPPCPPAPLLLFGLTGYPLDHSLSPRLHEAALHETGLAGEYKLYLAPPLPEGAQALQELLARVRTGELNGLNVTIPHKQSVIRWLDELTPAASAIGAVNTIFLHEGALVGDNTDAPGFLADLERCLGSIGSFDQEEPMPAAVILGAGGSARAAAYALLQSGWWVFVAARRLEQAQELADSLAVNLEETKSRLQPDGWTENELANWLKPRIQGRIVPISISDLQSTIHNQQSSERRSHAIRLIVNATPLGMSPHLEASPWPDGVPLPDQAVAYDFVYNPPETVFLRTARAAGLPAFSGSGMLVEQAALAFERWTGVTAPRPAMHAAVKQAGRISPVSQKHLNRQEAKEQRGI